MHDDVPKTRDGAPRDIRFGGPNTVTQPLSGLSDGVKVAEDGVLHEVRLEEDAPATRGVFPDADNTVAYMFQQRQICVHVIRYRIWASFSTCSRKAGWSAASVTTSTRRPNRS